MSTSVEQICPVGRRRAYTGEKERSVKASPLRLLSKPEVDSTDFVLDTHCKLKAFRVLSSKGLRQF